VAAILGTNDTQSLQFETSGSVRMTISSSGNVGIGTTSPTNTLQVVGGITSTTITASSNISSSATLLGNNLTIGTGASTIGGTLSVASALTASTISASSNISGSSLRITGDTNLGGTLGVTGATTLQNNLVVSGSITLGSSSLQSVTSNVGTINSPTFFSGFGGSGWRINYDNPKYSLELDDLTVRGTMKVYELLIQQIRATNGSIFVANTGKIDSASLIDSTTNRYLLVFDTGSQYGHDFKVGDLLRAQRFNVDEATIYRCDLIVEGISGSRFVTASLSGIYGNSLYGTSLYGGSGSLSSTFYPPTGGMEFVRIGNTTNTDRQGTVYLTADDNNSPFIDVKDGVTAHSEFNSYSGTKVRMGKLNGIVTPTFGNLSGYGLWASGSVYLEGGINATTGKIGGWDIISTAITKSKIELKSTTNDGPAFIRVGDLAVDSNGIETSGKGILLSSFIGDGSELYPRFFIGSTADSYIRYESSGDTLEIQTPNFILDTNGNATLSGTITASAGLIGGFSTTLNEIQTTSSITAIDNDTNTSITYPNLRLSKEGDISGSSLVIRSLIPSASTFRSYNLIDTETGVADFKNIGRQIINQIGVINNQSVNSTNNQWITAYDSPACYLLPGENLLLITAQFYGNVGIGSNYTINSKAKHDVRIIVLIASGSNNINDIGNPKYDNQAGRIMPFSPSTTFPFQGLSSVYYVPDVYINNWITQSSDPSSYVVWQLSTELNKELITQNQAPSGGLGVLITPSSSIGVGIIPTGSRNQYVKFFLQTLVSGSTGTPTSVNAYTALTNTTLTVARGYAAASAGGGIDIYDPNSNSGIREL